MIVLFSFTVTEFIRASDFSDIVVSIKFNPEDDAFEIGAHKIAKITTIKVVFVLLIISNQLVVICELLEYIPE